MTVRLPVVGSHAASTPFAVTRLDGPGGLHLWLDSNGKVTAGNGTYDAPRANALSLVHVEDCPGSTPSCRAACYVHNLTAAQEDLAAKYRHNSATIRWLLGEPPTHGHFMQWADDYVAWSQLLATWIVNNASGGFRWHVSGDIFAERYAEFIAETVWYVHVIADANGDPRPRQWIYTRSFDFVEPLLEVATVNGGSLSVNLSADRDNYAAAVELASKHDLRICYMLQEGDEVPWDLCHGDVIFPDYALRSRDEARPFDSPFWQSLTPRQRQMVCPVDMRGASERRRCGPERCDRCLK